MNINKEQKPRGFNYAAFVFYYLIFGRHKLARRKRRKLAGKQFEDALNNAPENAIAIDCGANIGYITGLLLDKGFRVHAFEPDPVAAEVLLRKVGSNPRLSFNPVAVGAAKGRAKLFRTSDFESSPANKTVSSSLLARKESDPKNYVDVEVINLLEYIEAIPDRISMLKIDIEGAEVELLEALIESGLEKKIDFIFVETHERISFHIALQTARLRARIRTQNLTNFNLDHN